MTTGRTRAPAVARAVCLATHGALAFGGHSNDDSLDGHQPSRQSDTSHRTKLGTSVRDAWRLQCDRPSNLNRRELNAKIHRHRAGPDDTDPVRLRIQQIPG